MEERAVPLNSPTETISGGADLRRHTKADDTGPVILNAMTLK